MNAIKAEVGKGKGSKEKIYSFQVNNEAFKAHYSRKESTLRITHNEAPLGTIYGTIDKGRKVEYEVSSNAEPLKITAWIDPPRASFSNLYQPLRGIGIEVNGAPVQHTLADPETHILNGRNFLYLFLFILGFKSAVVFYSIYERYSSLAAAAITSAIYFVPLIIVLIAAIRYKAWTTFAILSSIVISASETVDYIWGLANASGGSMVAFWMLLRIWVLFALCNAFRWKLKQKKSNSSNKGNS